MQAANSTHQGRVLVFALHVVFWLAVLIFYAVFFGGGWSFENSLLFVACLLPVVIATTYFVNYYLVPQFLTTDRTWQFIIYLVYTILGAVLLEMLIVLFIFMVIARFDIHGMSPTSIRLPFLLAALLLVVFLALAFELHFRWRSLRATNEELLRQKIESEMRFLRTQLQPHFLFNTLNNIYSLAHSQSSRTPDAILSLSRVLDYVLHGSETTKVRLSRELDVLRDFIQLESLRYSDRLTTDVSITGQPESYDIVPMTLLTLIENAFKHGPAKGPGNHFIRVAVHCADDIQISIVNSCAPALDAGHGIGLENLRRQLELVYGPQVEFNAQKNEQIFTVNLRLP